MRTLTQLPVPSLSQLSKSKTESTAVPHSPSQTFSPKDSDVREGPDSCRNEAHYFWTKIILVTNTAPFWKVMNYKKKE